MEMTIEGKVKAVDYHEKITEDGEISTYTYNLETKSDCEIAGLTFKSYEALSIKQGDPLTITIKSAQKRLDEITTTPGGG